VEIIAHRGAPRQYPENTLPGFRQALDWGADAIELDVRLTRDGVVVVHHDPAPRTPPGAPRLSTLTVDDLARNQPTIPTLAAVLAAVDARATVYVEIKEPGIEDVVLSDIARSSTPCAVHGFDHRVAVRVGRRAPTGVLLCSYLIDPVATLHATGARDWWQEWPLIDQTLVDRIHDAGARLIAWTVNDPADARALRDMGVDGICTDVANAMRFL
jgi:glycerophosphoryl diester phosphodiesterase